MGSKIRPRYFRGRRQNAGIVFPQFVLHAALTPMIDELGRGIYAKDAQQEVLFTSISEDLVDACFHKLQQRPPAVSLQFPVERAQLPMVTIRCENMIQESPVIGDDAGLVDEDETWSNDELALTPDTGAVGGETSFPFPFSGELNTRSVVMVIRRGSDDIPLDYDASDYTISGHTVTLADPLVAGDHLIVTQHATYGLAGGDLFGYQLRFNYVIFIDTDNAILTSFLSGLVWRELVLKHDQLLASGVVDIDVGFRSISLWEQVVPPLGDRIEITVSGLTDWVAYKKTTQIRSVESTIQGTTVSGAAAGQTGADGEVILVMDTELAVYESTATECGEE